MIKNTILLIVLLLTSFLLFSQEMIEEEEEVENENGFNMGGSAGAVIMGGETYSRIRLMPELAFGKFGIGLDLDILIDSNGNIREEDWDDAKDIMNKTKLAKSTVNYLFNVRSELLEKYGELVIGTVKTPTKYYMNDDGRQIMRLIYFFRD